MSAQELVEEFLGRIDALDGELNSFITVMADSARAQARECDRLRRSDPRPLHGFVVAVKDDIDVAGVRCTAGSRFFADRIADADAEVVRRLRARGAIVIGKVTMHEFAYGATTNNPHFGTCRNPWDTTRIPGGSSGGSGVAVAAGLCMGALGSDGGGSVRIPAALNGVSGLRPTLGTVSQEGVLPIVWSFETVGPMARAVADVAALHDALVAPAAGEATWRGDQANHLGGIVIGVPRHFFFDDVDPEICDAVRAAADELERLGAAIVDVDVSGAGDAVETATIVSRAEALAMHADRLERSPELFGDDVRARLELGRAISGAQLARALEQMRAARTSLSTTFGQVDVVLSPTTEVVAPPIVASEMIPTTARLTRLTWPWSVAGCPALSVPCGLSGEGLPIGLQLAAARHRDGLLLRIGNAYQQATDWHRRWPPAHVERGPDRRVPLLRDTHTADRAS
jgi:aspartyl-tRNA(Asn)/glutamyl-tRNA(Gln) amidotransferase subunit A